MFAGNVWYIITPMLLMQACATQTVAMFVMQEGCLLQSEMSTGTLE